MFSEMNESFLFIQLLIRMLLIYHTKWWRTPTFRCAVSLLLWPDCGGREPPPFPSPCCCSHCCGCSPCVTTVPCSPTEMEGFFVCRKKKCHACVLFVESGFTPYNSAAFVCRSGFHKRNELQRYKLRLC